MWLINSNGSRVLYTGAHRGSNRLKVVATRSGRSWIWRAWAIKGWKNGEPISGAFLACGPADCLGDAENLASALWEAHPKNTMNLQQSKLGRRR